MNGPRPPFGGRRPRQVPPENTPVQEPLGVTEQTPVHPFGRRHKVPFGENPVIEEVPNATEAPKVPQSGYPPVMGRRRVRPSNEQTEIPVAPPVPQVPAREANKPVRGDSMLEAIIKLVNSLLNFRGK